MKRIIEALLIATDIPLSLKKMVEILKISEVDIKKYVDELNQEYRATERAFEIKEVAGGFQIYTLPEFAEWLNVLQERRTGLSKAALETVAIIAYHQPITRAEIEKLRGVDSTGVLDTLMQKGLIKTCGRLPVPGRPIRYGTTQEFLRYFGIKDISELPSEEDFGVRPTAELSEKSEEVNLATPSSPQELVADKEATIENREDNSDIEESSPPSTGEDLRR